MFSGHGIENLVQDIRYALRSLRKAFAFTAVASLALALGIGANTVLFSVISFTLLRPLPFPELERIIILTQTAPNVPKSSVAWPNYLDWRTQAGGLFTEFAATRRESFNLTSNGEPERVVGQMATFQLLPLTGFKPILGRVYSADEDKPGAPRTVVLTHGFWQRRFGADPTIVGKSIQLSDESYTVIGVLPKDFRFLSEGDLFVPLGLFADRYQNRRMQVGIYVFGRMKPGVTLSQVQRVMDGVSARLVDVHPELRGNGIRAALLRVELVAGARPALLVLWGAVVFVLLIAAANVANLLLARATAREGEIAVRVALGAGRFRIVRQLLTESVLLSGLGGAVGLGLASWGLRALSPLLASLPGGKDVRINVLALVFTVGVSLVTGVGFGLFPALRASDSSVQVLLNNVRNIRTHARLRSALIVTEVALSMVLLIGAGLLLRSFGRLTGVQPGFDPKNVLTAGIALPPSRYRDAASIEKFTDEFRRRTTELPGVAAAAVAQGMPLLGAPDSSFMFEGKEPANPSTEPKANMYAVTPGYFDVMRIPVLRGRVFEEPDKNRNVILIDERMAGRYFAGEDPIGRRMAGNGPFPPFEIIGVVGHVRNYNLEDNGPVDMAYYVPHGTLARVLPGIVASGYVVLRSQGDPAQISAPLRRLVEAIDPLQPIFSVRPMDEVVSNSVSDRRLNVVLLGIFAAVALLLASVGIYGVMSYSVEQRKREIGIRMALGADGNTVLRLIIWEGARLATTGISLGVVGALALSRVMAALLYGVSATDPFTYAGLAAVLAAVAVGACVIPARRAVRVDPAVSLVAQ